MGLPLNANTVPTSIYVLSTSDRLAEADVLIKKMRYLHPSLVKVIVTDLVEREWMTGGERLSLLIEHLPQVTLFDLLFQDRNHGWDPQQGFESPERDRR